MWVKLSVAFKNLLIANHLSHLGWMLFAGYTVAVVYLIRLYVDICFWAIIIYMNRLFVNLWFYYCLNDQALCGYMFELLCIWSDYIWICVLTIVWMIRLYVDMFELLCMYMIRLYEECVCCYQKYESLCDSYKNITSFTWTTVNIYEPSWLNDQFIVLFPLIFYRLLPLSDSERIATSKNPYKRFHYVFNKCYINVGSTENDCYVRKSQGGCYVQSLLKTCYIRFTPPLW